MRFSAPYVLGLPARCAGQWPGPSSLFVGVALATYLLAERNLRRRSTEIWDNVLLGVCGLVTILVVPHVAGLDMRFGWPPIARYIEVLALLLNIYGWALHIWAMRSNADFAIVVRLQQDRGQTVVTCGPYRFVRHPGYPGGIAFNLSTPLTLSSLWAPLLGIIGASLLVLRTTLEDRFLQEKPPGYSSYAESVRQRLIPGGWQPTGQIGSRKDLIHRRSLNIKRTRLDETGARNLSQTNRISGCTSGFVTDLFRLVRQTGAKDTWFRPGRELGNHTHDLQHCSPPVAFIFVDRAQESDMSSLPSQLLNPLESHFFKSA